METDKLNTDEVRLTSVQCVAESIQMNRPLIILDSRSPTEFSSGHILEAINIGGDHAYTRKFSENRVPMDKLLLKLLDSHDLSNWKSVPIVVYDHSLEDIDRLNPECFMYNLLCQLSHFFIPIYVLKGGFLAFQAEFSQLCGCGNDRVPDQDSSARSDSPARDLERLLDECLSEAAESSSYTLPSSQFEHSGPLPGQSSRFNDAFQSQLDSYSSFGETSQPDLPEPFADVPPCPSCIRPHLILGSQVDALNQKVYEEHGITHVLNVSVSSPTSPHVPPERFMRISILDNHTASLLPHLDQAFEFIDKAKAIEGHVLVHCAAGISRSPTVVIAYLMHSERIQFREAYEFVKSKRSSIAPNFNFLGQLLELNCQLFPSASSGNSIFGSGESTPTHLPKSLGLNRLGPPGPSCKPPAGQPVPIPSSTSKHAPTKKRERPNHLSLDMHSGNGDEFAHPTSGTHSYQSSPIRRSVAGSPSEGKRSRVSLLTPPFSLTTADQFLPSPCTRLSSLQLSSPLDPQYSLAQTLISQSSMDKLHYEPCSVGGGESSPFPSDTSSGQMRRSLTSLGMAGASPRPVRRTLLAERRVSNQQSAPSTPSRLAVEQVRLQQTGPECDLPSPGSTATSCASSVPFTRDFSPIAERPMEPSIEHDELQQSALSYSPDLIGRGVIFEPKCLSKLPDRYHCSHDHHTDSFPVLCTPRFSQSAPVHSHSVCWFADPDANWKCGLLDRTNPAHSDPPFMVLVQSPFQQRLTSSRLARMRTHSLGLELSCRQEESLWHGDPSIPFPLQTRSSLSSSTGNLCTRTLAAI